ncbi:uncharacterized protein LOC142634775 [Castanea sativa]|uniref:uncharacterized protein LOC142634775 n=1 Tax=Castanea sativa TaxID=21020 RepID=UPI003F64C8B0
MVANPEWKGLFPRARVQHRSTAASDHCSLVLHSNPTARNKREKPYFRFETMWVRDAKCKEIIELAWSMPNSSIEVPMIQERIKSYQQQLQWWNKNGDRNTKFFHSMASQRHMKNTVQGLVDDHGVCKDNAEDINRNTLDYYTSIFTSDLSTQFDAVE